MVHGVYMLIVLLLVLLQVFIKHGDADTLTGESLSTSYYCYTRDTDIGVSCSQDQSIVVAEVELLSKLKNTCDVIDSTTEATCCTRTNTDCAFPSTNTEVQEKCNGKSSCGQGALSIQPTSTTCQPNAASFRAATTAEEITSYCVDSSRIRLLDDSYSVTQTNSDWFYIQNFGYGQGETILSNLSSVTCSVETDVCADGGIDFARVHFSLISRNGICEQHLTITDDLGSSTVYDCNTNTGYNITVDTYNTNYLMLKFDNNITTDKGGTLWVGFRATNLSANMIIVCPHREKTVCSTTTTTTTSTTTTTRASRTTTMAPTTTTPRSDIGIIVGSVVGSVLTVIGIIVGVCIYRKKRSTRAITEEVKDVEQPKVDRIYDEHRSDPKTRRELLNSKHGSQTSMSSSESSKSKDDSQTSTSSELSTSLNESTTSISSEHTKDKKEHVSSESIDDSPETQSEQLEYSDETGKDGSEHVYITPQKFENGQKSPNDNENSDSESDEPKVDSTDDSENDYIKPQEIENKQKSPNDNENSDSESDESKVDSDDDSEKDYIKPQGIDNGQTLPNDDENGYSESDEPTGDSDDDSENDYIKPQEIENKQKSPNDNENGYSLSDETVVDKVDNSAKKHPPPPLPIRVDKKPNEEIHGPFIIVKYTNHKQPHIIMRIKPLSKSTKPRKRLKKARSKPPEPRSSWPVLDPRALTPVVDDMLWSASRAWSPLVCPRYEMHHDRSYRSVVLPRQPGQPSNQGIA